MLFSILLLSSCQKELKLDEIKTDPLLSNKVTEWLTQQKISNTTERINKIDLLGDNLELNKLWVEQGSNNDEILVIPIKEGLNFENKKYNKKVSNYLLLFSDDKGKIKKSYIIQNRLEGSQHNTDIRSGTISNIYNGKNIKDDCTIRYLNIYNKFLVETKYEGGKLKSSSVINEKNNYGKQNFESSTASNCLDWYWVTTYADGSQTWQYLGTTCDCTSGDPMNETLICDDGSGGGGSGGGGSSVDEQISNQFNSYAQQTSLTVSFSSPSTNYGPDPIADILTWTVVKGLIAGWHVDATTQYKYYHNRHFDINLNGFVHTYNLFDYRTLSTNYIGSNIAIESTWTQTGVLDQVLNNNTANTQGKSTVSGTLRHRLRQPLPISGSILDVTEAVSGTVNFNPR